jgi:hypothetical protein
MPANASLRNSGIRQHLGENIAIQHALYRHAIRSGFDARNTANGIDQSLTMVRARSAQQSSVDIEKHQGFF